MNYDDYVIYRTATPCTCEMCLYAARIDAEFAARRAVVAAVNARQATHTMDEANELNERQYHALQSALGPLVNSIYVPLHQRICPTCGAPMQASTPAADPPSTAKDVLPHAGSITDPTFDASTPAQPAPGQLTETERQALADRIGDIGLSKAIDDARGPHDDQVIVSAPVQDANIANEPKPSGYMSRKKML